MKSVIRRYLKFSIIILAGCFAVFLVLFVFVLLPQERLKTTTKTQYNQLQDEAALAIAASQGSLKEQLDRQIDNMNQQLDNFIFTQADAGNLTYDISKISSDIGLEAFSISSAGTERIPLYDSCKYVYAKRIQASFNADFNKFAIFVNFLEKNSPVIFIDNFSIIRSTQAGTGNKVTMELAVLVSKNDNS